MIYYLYAIYMRIISFSSFQYDEKGIIIILEFSFIFKSTDSSFIFSEEFMYEQIPSKSARELLTK